MNLTRRDLLKAGLVASGSLMLPEGLFPIQALAQPVQPIVVPFRTPTLLEPVYTGKTPSGTPIDFYVIEMSKSKKLVPGREDKGEVEIWGYNGEFPGPTIKQMKGRESVVYFINKLGQDSDNEDIKAVVHLHGMASLPQYDGYAEDFIPPGYYKEYLYPNDRAATIWYHDHTLHKTKRNVAQGLFGMYIVQDELELKLNLPSEDYDVPVILHGHEDSSLNGDTLVNGAYQPVMQVANRKYRFRLLNASASNVYNLQIHPDINEGLTVIGTDAGLREHPVKVKEPLPMVMGERYEIIIDFSNYVIGTAIDLETVDTSKPDQPKQTLMSFNVTRAEKDDSDLPPTLRKFNPWLRQQASQTRVFTFDKDGPPLECNTISTWAINGKVWDSSQVCYKPILENIEIWRLENKGSALHPVHVHLLDMHLLSRNGGESPTSDDYDYNWKDVFPLKANETIEIIGRFGPHKGKYMMHCHNLFHEDCDMMIQYEVCGQDEGSGELICDGPDPVKTDPAQPLPTTLAALEGYQSLIADYLQSKNIQLS